MITAPVPPSLQPWLQSPLLTRYSPHISSLCANLLLVTWCLFSLTHTNVPLWISQVILLFQDGRKLAYGGMQGIPMMATSPGNKDHTRNISHTKVLSSHICLMDIILISQRHTFPSQHCSSFSVRHEPPHGVNPVDIHGYEPPWKALSDFAMHQNLERMDPSGPQFQHLVGQVSLQGHKNCWKYILKFMVDATND